MALRSYNPNDCTIYFAGNLLTQGIVSISIAPVERTFTTLKGIDGDTTRVLSNNRDHVCTITVMGTSPINDVLSSIWRLGQSGLNAGGIGTFSLVDSFGTTNVSTNAAYIENPPTMEWAAEPGERSWELRLVDPIINHGGLVPVG
jgi:hypothetical protein